MIQWNTEMSFLTLVFLAILASCSATFQRESFIILVGPKEKSCFSKTFTTSVKVVYEYKVTAGGNRDVDARIVSPNGLVIYKEMRTKGDELTFSAQNGDFKFCFSNEFSKITSKRIAFNIRPYDEASLSEEAGENVPKVKGPLEAFCDNIHFLMTTVMDFQMKYMIRESTGRFIAENLNKRVMWWSLGQGILVMLTGLGQVFIFKKFFTEKRISSKPTEVTTMTT